MTLAQAIIFKSQDIKWTKHKRKKLKKWTSLKLGAFVLQKFKNGTSER